MFRTLEHLGQHAPKLQKSRERNLQSLTVKQELRLFREDMVRESMQQRKRMWQVRRARLVN